MFLFSKHKKDIKKKPTFNQILQTIKIITKNKCKIEKKCREITIYSKDY